MATILDIAREAGVSHGTVSNVLNQKGNVSVEKIKLVEEAAKKLGYKINYSAKSLRQGQNDLVAVIIPEYYLEYSQLYSAINNRLSQNGFKVQSYITHDIKEIEENVIDEIAKERVQAVFTVSCLANASHYYDSLGHDMDIFFIERKPQNTKHYISFDFQLAAEDISDYLAHFNPHEIGIFLSDKTYQPNKIMTDVLKEKLSLADEAFVYSKKGQDYRNAFNLVNQLTKKVIFTNNSNRAALLKKASYYSDCVDQVTILCLTSDTITPVESNDHYILNHYYLGIQVATIFLESVQKQYLKENYIIPNDGFPKTNLKSYPNTTIKMLTLSSPTSHAIVNLAKDFTRKTSIEIDITILPYDQFNLELETNSQAYDLIRTDMALLSYQGQTIYQELDGISTELDQLIKRFGHFYQETFMEIGKSVYALPLDPSVQMLFYREDIFSNQIVQRTFFERYKKELKLPTSFEEYTELVTFFSTEKLGVDYGTVINTKNPVIIASEFLSAYYSLGGKLVENETSINLDPAFSEEAMRLYKLLHDQAKAIDKNWWNDLVKAFSNGNVAMIIGYINHLSTIADSEIGSLISYTSVPNHHPILGGGVIGITKSSLLVEPSSQFLLWLHTAEVSKEITLLGGTSVDSKIGQSEMVHQTYPWLLSIDQTLKTGIRETNLAVDKGFNLIKFEELIGQTINNLVENDDYKETANKLNEVLTSHAANYLTKSIKKN